MRKMILAILLGCIVLTVATASEALILKSPAFKDGGKLPTNSGYENENCSPALEWEDVPENTVSYVLIMDDPDAQGWVHWIVFNIPAGVKNLKERFSKEEELRDGTRQGKNGFGKIGYGGPCPPSGSHRYVFKLYALDKMLDAGPGVQKSAILKSMKAHIIAETKLTGSFRR